MELLKTTSAAKAFLLGSDYLIKYGNKEYGLTEIINAIIEIENFEYGEFEKDFDKKFREIFGNERIDFASSVTFIEPVITPRGKEYPTIKDGWQNSYWGRMTNWENKFNQFENVVNILKQGKNTKRCEMIVYHPTYDAKKMFRQPCLLTIDFKPRGKDLYMTANFRSQRITKSGYADYSALINMGEYLAEECNINLKRITNIACSLHLGGKENNELENTKKILKYFDGKF